MHNPARAMLWLAAAAVLASISAGGGRVQAEDPNSAPNPYHVVEHWAQLPDGRVWGQAIGVDIDVTALVFGSSIAAVEKPAKARISRQFRNWTQLAAW